MHVYISKRAVWCLSSCVFCRRKASSLSLSEREAWKFPPAPVSVCLHITEPLKRKEVVDFLTRKSVLLFAKCKQGLVESSFRADAEYLHIFTCVHIQTRRHSHIDRGWVTLQRSHEALTSSKRSVFLWKEMLLWENVRWCHVIKRALSWQKKPVHQRENVKPSVKTGTSLICIHT